MLPVKQWQKNEEMMEIYLDNKSFDLIKSGFYFKVVWNPSTDYYQLVVKQELQKSPLKLQVIRSVGLLTSCQKVLTDIKDGFSMHAYDRNEAKIEKG